MRYLALPIAFCFALVLTQPPLQAAQNANTHVVKVKAKKHKPKAHKAPKRKNHAHN